MIDVLVCGLCAVASGKVGLLRLWSLCPEIGGLDPVRGKDKVKSRDSVNSRGITAASIAQILVSKPQAGKSPRIKLPKINKLSKIKLSN